MASITPIDWVGDVCTYNNFMAASYENKIYTVGGTLVIQLGPNLTTIADSYLRILDFSKPVDPSKNSIDISTDLITIAKRLPDDVPLLVGAILIISDGVMHMLPGDQVYPEIVADEDGNIHNYSTWYDSDLVNRVWHFDLEAQKWRVRDSGIEDPTSGAAVAFDEEKQVGWYYGGYHLLARAGSQDLYRLDKGKGTPIIVDTNSSIVGNVTGGELIYIGGAGEAGVLVLMGGYLNEEAMALSRPIEEVYIFDIATETWYTQSTTAEARRPPSASDGSDFCAVVASAEDNSSHNIYIYGGYLPVGRPSNEVFILTLPAFHWVAVYPSLTEDPDVDVRRTYQHRCLKIHEKYMVAYRGLTESGICDSDPKSMRFQGMAIYDMSSLTWTTKVELEDQKYSVPQALYEIIGGNEKGNATITEPSQSSNPKVAQLFAKKTTAVNTPTPGSTTTPGTATPGSTTTPVSTTIVTVLPTNDHSPKRVSVGAIVGGVVGGLIFVLLIALFLLRRRQRMVVPPKLPPELASTPFNPRELQGNELYELSQDPRRVFELSQDPRRVFELSQDSRRVFELSHDSRKVLELPPGPIDLNNPVS